MMRCTLYFSVVILFILIIKLHGDDNVAYPNFPRQAEFTIESIIIDGQHRRTYVECIYDYDKNRLIIISEETFESSNYATLKKAVYSKNTFKQCDVYPIDIDNPLDGFSGMTDPDDSTTHIRPLNDFLLLTSSATYLNETILRGSVYVDQWITSLANDTDIIWSFAKSNYVMPWNPHEYTIPVQRVIKRKEDGLILQVLNIFDYKPMITRTDLTPPRGIFCQNLVPSGNLLSLQDYGMIFPDKFSVRIDASSTSQQLWQTMHLRYLFSDGRKFIRYDFTSSDNTQNPTTIILDYTQSAPRSYKIDRRTGTCVVNDSVEIILGTSILHNPIEALIKHEGFLLSNPPHRIFQYTGNRFCRGSITCTIFVGQLPSFPPDTNDAWLAANIEWAWSKRNMDDINAPYDYPVYLNLNLYRPTNGPPANVHYEFYDYRTDVHLNDFDVNLCYRSNQFWYQHLAFQLKIKDQSTADGIENGSIDRRRLNENIRELIMNLTTVKYLRISQVELDHHPNQPGHRDTLYCIFTLLDRTPFVNPNNETEMLDAQRQLEAGINSGSFQIITAEGLSLEAVPNSLESIQYFYVFNPNSSVDHLSYVHVNQTIQQIVEEVHEKIQYSDGAQAGAVIGGMVVGILSGVFIVFIVIFMIKRKANESVTGGFAFGNISFRIGRNRTKSEQATITMDNPMHHTQETST